MSTLLHTPDSSRDSSTISSSPLQNRHSPTSVIMAKSPIQQQHQQEMSATMIGRSNTPDSKNSSPGINNNSLVFAAGTPPSPRACDTAIIIPRRIFVGGFPQATTEDDLREFFLRFGSVRDVKIIRDHAATAKGKYSYGFVTFETDEEAQKLIAIGKAEGATAFEFNGRYLNVNEAVKKPPFNKMLPLDAVPPSGVVLRDINGQLFTIQNGLAIVANPEHYAIAQPQPPTPSYHYVLQHPVYVDDTAPPAPLKYAHQPQSAFTHIQSPASAPVLSQHQQSATHTQKPGRFVFPPLASLPPPAPINGNQVGQLPPTPVASPVNPESPSKSMMSFTGNNNPAITNLTNPFPTVIGATQQQQQQVNMQPSSPYRYQSASTMTAPLTQLYYPGAYPYVQEINNPYQAVPIQHAPYPAPPVGAAMFPTLYSPDCLEYSFPALDYTAHEIQPAAAGDRSRSSKNVIYHPHHHHHHHHQRLDGGVTLKE